MTSLSKSSDNRQVPHRSLQHQQLLAAGTEDIVRRLEGKLGIKKGHTTPDGKCTLKTVECPGSYGTAPMMMIGAQFHENLTLEKVEEVVEDWERKGERSRYC